ncbi:hypothetical protein [Chloroflexus aggregans]|uniref:Uncharacterized protein n=1 Tax=Chloroflexus aggregans (strain MD-66 / DSM 9485) TaxID=326427 RepID=B8G754_CHLAD|nr:hypothetical protein [Chloroflexus aggregans]ACL24011.1 conserved hypothetical protein [Chloroflexus aggregans DSM 9485]
MHDEEIQRLIAQRLPAEVRAGPAEIRRYSDEIVIILPIARPLDDIPLLREQTRRDRMRVAREIERHLGVPVAWGMRSADHEVLFTTRTVPVMTRLGRAERELLDLLVAVGVADTRSSALAYIARAFAYEHREWLNEVRLAVGELARVRARLQLQPRSGPPVIPPEVTDGA